MKKILVTLVLVMLFWYAVFPVYADDSIMAYDASSLVMIANLSFSNGKVVGSAIIHQNGGTKIEVTVTIQKQSGSSWVAVASSQGNSNISVSASATKGITYRTLVTCKVKDSYGNVIANQTKTSSEKEY